MTDYPLERGETMRLDVSVAQNPLCELAYDGELHGIKKYLEENKGAESFFNEFDEYDRTPLMTAVMQKQVDVINYILSLSTESVNIQGQHGTTALHIALLDGANRPDIVEILLRAGADTNICDDGGEYPIFIAAGQRSKNLVLHLIHAGAQEGMDKAIAVCDHNLDIETGDLLRKNYAQIQADLMNKAAEAKALERLKREQKRKAAQAKRLKPVNSPPVRKKSN